MQQIERYAITFGETAILHVGGSSLGHIRDVGYTIEELRHIAIFLQNHGYVTELVMISDALPPELRVGNEAATLVIRGGARLFGKSHFPSRMPAFGEGFFVDQLLEEQRGVAYDQFFFDRGQMKHKRARYNIVFGDTEVMHSDDYKQYSVKAFSSLPYLNHVRNNLATVFGTKAAGLNAEGNKYFEAKSGISYHGDSERKIVICLSLGSSSILRYCWRLPGSSDNGKPVDIVVNGGDIYIMSEKATGFDWRMRSKVRAVHAAGHHALS